ncbi:MAG TPA: ATP-binding cassette domain-containing protein [Baekduia sp.]|nr:ATP-binding cassette domain-containing protein [Baekduia sp.]
MLTASAGSGIPAATSPEAAPPPLPAALAAALASGSHAVRRLCHAKTSVALRVPDTPELSATLLLDRRPCEVTGPEPAEIELVLSAQQAAQVAAGRLALTTAVLCGDVPYSGPVRRFLAVEPVVRAALAELAGTDPAAVTRPAGAPSGTLDPELLAIETRGLHKSFGRTAVLEGLDLQIPEGVISVVLGPSGTGKSVLLQHVIGLLAPDAGDVLIRGRPLSRMRRDEILALRRGIGVMFQDGALFSTMNVFDNVAFPLRQHTSLEDHQIRELVHEHLAQVGLAAAGDRMPSQLSGGMRKRAGLARALVLAPTIMLCDEPDSGLDPVRTALLGDLLVEQHAAFGGTMVVVTHNVPLARRIAEHVSVLWRGRVVASGLAADVFSSQAPFVQQFLSGAAEGPLGMDA